MKVALVSALCACAGNRQKRKARRFLEGLSEDELRYIAEFFGACILESAAGCPEHRVQLAENVAVYDLCRSGSEAPPRPSANLAYNEHKMILLREYLSRCEVNESPVPVRLRRHAG